MTIPDCGDALPRRPDGSQKQSPQKGGVSGTRIPAMLLALLGAVCCGIAVSPFLLGKDFTPLLQEEARKTEVIKKQYEDQLAARHAAFEKELAAIDAKDLERKAVETYKNELAARRSCDKRFALTPREKTLLRMKELASDSTKSLHETIRAIAREASPNGADIRVRESSFGVSLDVDFDMSSMTSGEQGSRTKHRTKESLRREVTALISRATSDILQFCGALNLLSIHVGCRHHVELTDRYGLTRSDENIVLYKMRIRKNRVPELTSNPFLNVYSTTKYFEVEEDNFDEIEIVTTRI